MPPRQVVSALRVGTEDACQHVRPCRRCRAAPALLPHPKGRVELPGMSGSLSCGEQRTDIKRPFRRKVASGQNQTMPELECRQSWKASLCIVESRSRAFGVRVLPCFCRRQTGRSKACCHVRRSATRHDSGQLSRGWNRSLRDQGEDQEWSRLLRRRMRGMPPKNAADISMGRGAGTTSRLRPSAVSPLPQLQVVTWPGVSPS